MNIVVCVKQVFDTNIIEIDENSGSIDSTDTVYVVNPYDMFALEQALDIKDRDSNSQITVISMGPPSAKRILRRCLALGADKAMLVSNQNLETADSYVTGGILAKAISSLQYDLILCGEKAVDTGAGMVGAVIADILGIPLVSRVTKIDIPAGATHLIVQRKLDKGNKEAVKAPIPALLTVETQLNEPRYAGLPALMQSLREDIKEYNASDLGLSPTEMASRSSNINILHLSPPKPRPKKVFVPDKNLSAAERMRLTMSGGVTKKQGDLIEGDPKEIALKVIQFLNQQDIIS